MEDILNNNNGGGKKTGNPVRKFPDFIPKQIRIVYKTWLDCTSVLIHLRLQLNLMVVRLTMYCVMPNSNHYCDKRGIIRKFFDKLWVINLNIMLVFVLRNIELKDNGNQFWETVKQNGNLQAMIDYCVEHNTSVAVQR